jgi:hypothetical protein
VSHYITPLQVEDVDEFAGTWRLTGPLVFVSDLLLRTITVPQGFVTDFASVPRLPVIYLAEGGKGEKAATLHDWAYSSQFVPREQADALLREALLACGYSAFTAGLFYAAVRMGGASHWKAPNVPQTPEVAAAMKIA